MSIMGVYKYLNVNIYGGFEEILSLRLIYGMGCVFCDMFGEEVLIFINENIKILLFLCV